MDRRELRDVPRPDLVRCGRRERGLRVGPGRPLIPALTRLPGSGEDAVHRADGREIDAASEQRGVHLSRRLVGELRALERVEDALPLGVVEAARAGRTHALKRCPEIGVEVARSGSPRGSAGGRTAAWRNFGYLTIRREPQARARRLAAEASPESRSRNGGTGKCGSSFPRTRWSRRIPLA